MVRILTSRPIAWIVVLLSTSLLIYNLRFVMVSRDDATRVAMKLKLRQIAFGLNEYYRVNHLYPPNRVIVNTVAGKRGMQSWRALLLPMIDDKGAERYDVQRPWDATQNLLAAKSIDSYSNFSGGHSTSLFLTNDACLIKTTHIDLTPVDAILLLATPEPLEIWSNPSELSVEELWDAVQASPKLTMVGLSGGESIPLRDLISSAGECEEVLNYGRLSEERQKAYQLKVARWRKGHHVKQ